MFSTQAFPSSLSLVRSGPSFYFLHGLFSSKICRLIEIMQQLERLFPSPYGCGYTETTGLDHYFLPNSGSPRSISSHSIRLVSNLVAVGRISINNVTTIDWPNNTFGEIGPDNTESTNTFQPQLNTQSIDPTKSKWHDFIQYSPRFLSQAIASWSGWTDCASTARMTLIKDVFLSTRSEVSASRTSWQCKYQSFQENPAKINKNSTVAAERSKSSRGRYDFCRLFDAPSGVEVCGSGALRWETRTSSLGGRGGFPPINRPMGAPSKPWTLRYYRTRPTLTDTVFDLVILQQETTFWGYFADWEPPSAWNPLWSMM